MRWNSMQLETISHVTESTGALTPQASAQGGQSRQQQARAQGATRDITSPGRDVDARARILGLQKEARGGD